MPRVIKPKDYESLMGRAEQIVGDFHALHYFHPPSQRSYWRGVPINKCPFDIWNIQEIVYMRQPDVFIECGTSFGGFSVFIADVMEIIGKGVVITVDIEDKVGAGIPYNRFLHKRVVSIVGSSVDREVVKNIKKMIPKGSSVMVDLDSSHETDHVLEELNLYGKMVTKNEYMICEDTNIPRTQKAVKTFLANNEKNWTIDSQRTYKYLVTFNPGGYLLKK